MKCRCVLLEIIGKQRERIAELINVNQEQAGEIEVLMKELIGEGEFCN